MQWSQFKGARTIGPYLVLEVAPPLTGKFVSLPIEQLPGGARERIERCAGGTPASTQS